MDDIFFKIELCSAAMQNYAGRGEIKLKVKRFLTVELNWIEL
jgi:hypothetical protein